ncbi:DUF6207 family protein [Streptomyces sp. NPDC092307]|uniref:DUF6207 family protein n=1 Tax=Streptomyces sp. NPDC092307 TaxID=3366013 RepID=UPI00382F68DB
MTLIDEQHVAEPGLLVLEITGGDEYPVRAVLAALKERWAASGVVPARQDAPGGSPYRGTRRAMGRCAGDVRLFQYGSQVGRVAVHGGEFDDASRAAPDRWARGAGRVLRPHAPVPGCAMGAAHPAPSDSGTRPCSPRD